jgi:hypothetical protein
MTFDWHAHESALTILWFSSLEHFIKFCYTHIDPRDPQQEYYFVVNVSKREYSSKW